MSNTKQPAKRTVKVQENDLVELIDNIVNEAVASRKKQWIAEQTAKNDAKNSLLETRFKALEAKVQRLTEGKK